MSTKIKKHLNCEDCNEVNEFYYLDYSDDLIHVINIFED